MVKYIRKLFKFCPSEADLLSFNDHQLSDAKASKVKTHLQNCRACQELLAAFQTVDEAFNSLTVIPAPLHILDKVKTRIKEETAAEIQPNFKKTFACGGATASLIKLHPIMSSAIVVLFFCSVLWILYPVLERSRTDQFFETSVFSQKLPGFAMLFEDRDLLDQDFALEEYHLQERMSEALASLAAEEEVVSETDPEIQISQLIGFGSEGEKNRIVCKIRM